MYDPGTARWLSDDPILFDFDNLGRYCHNDPVNRIDPDGLADFRFDVETGASVLEGGRTFAEGQAFYRSVLNTFQERLQYDKRYMPGGPQKKETTQWLEKAENAKFKYSQAKTDDQMSDYGTIYFQMLRQAIDSDERLKDSYNDVLWNRTEGTIYNPRAFWMSIVSAARDQGLPSFLFNFNQSQETSILPSADGSWHAALNPGFSRITGPDDRIVLIQGEGKKILDNPAYTIPAATRGRMDLGAVANESFSVWLNSAMKDPASHDWIAALFKPMEGKYSKPLLMCDEAMSELTDKLIGELKLQSQMCRSAGIDPPVFVLPNYTNALTNFSGFGPNMTPGHDGPGEKWAGDITARTPMSKDMYHATIWILEHGGANPDGSNGLQQNFDQNWSASRLSPTMKARLGR